MAKVMIVGSLADSLVHFRGDLLELLVSQGHAVTAVAARHDPLQNMIVADVRAALEHLGVRYMPIHMSRRTVSLRDDLATFENLRKLLRAESPDVMLTYTMKPVVYGSLAASASRSTRVYALITGVGSVLATPESRERLTGRALVGLLKLALRRSTVIFQNPDDRSLFRQLRIVRDQRTEIVHGSGVNLRRYLPQPMPAGAPVFLMLSRLHREKGIVEYWEAAKRVKNDHPDVRFQLGGPIDDSEYSLCKHLFDELLTGGVVEYLGTLQDVRPALGACSVFVLPSYHEGMPHSVLEAMATGRPIITTDTPGCRETVVGEQNGYLVPPRDASALAEAMERIISRCDRERMGAASLAIAREKFDVDLVNRHMLRIMGL